MSRLSIDWTERERAEFKARFNALEAGTFSAPSTGADPVPNEGIVLKRIDDTTLQVLMRGADGIVRSVDLTLS